jgi:hypothetical protein
MITERERNAAPDLFKEAIRAWAEAKKALSQPRRRPGSGPASDLAISGRFYSELARLGVDVAYKEALKCEHYFDDSGRECWERSDDLSGTRPEDITVWVPATETFVAQIVYAQRKFWNRAVGKHPAQPRFQEPEASDPTQIEVAAMEQLERLRRYLKPALESERERKRPPRYVIMHEGTHFTAKFGRYSKKVTLTGVPKRLMKLVEEAYTKVIGLSVPIDKEFSVPVARKAFRKAEPLYISYYEIAKVFPKEDRDGVEWNQANAESLNWATLDKATMAAVRKRVKRLNDAWRDQTGDREGVLLKDNGKGVWQLQAPLLLGIPREDRRPRGRRQ